MQDELYELITQKPELVISAAPLVAKIKDALLSAIYSLYDISKRYNKDMRNYINEVIFTFNECIKWSDFSLIVHYKQIESLSLETKKALQTNDPSNGYKIITSLRDDFVTDKDVEAIGNIRMKCTMYIHELCNSSNDSIACTANSIYHCIFKKSNESFTNSLSRMIKDIFASSYKDKCYDTLIDILNYFRKNNDKVPEVAKHQDSIRFMLQDLSLGIALNNNYVFYNALERIKQYKKTMM
jgi:hypothetical protein